MKLSNLFILAVILLVASCKPAKYADLEDGLYANMITNKGEILLQLTPNKTPMTVANFVSLANGTNTFVTDSLKGKKYYDGIVFHRVVPNFVIQAGDPTGTGEGGPGYRFKDEFPKNNEGELLLKHDTLGILSMANAGPATNGSQFFITHKATPHLDGKHSVFGKVVKGQNVVDSIAQMDTIKKVEIIRLGKDADNFRAAEVFENQFKKDFEEQKAKEKRITKIKEEKAEKFNELKPDAKELSSGLKYIITHTENGVKPEKGADIKVSCAGYFEDGMLFWTNWAEVAKNYEMYDHRQEDQGGYKPFPSIYSDEARLIPGFKEGLQKMRVGDKAVVFIPSHLGYGAQGSGNVIPPNSNLVFEIELVEVVNK